ncbi:MAG: transposase [Rickettsia endosymbiont of Ixodes persulcatus]|nr:transposase [Rickettsia endosymbiont of Ixodes persulcatus]
MTDIKPRIYPAEFKESAIKLAIESKQPFTQTARELQNIDNVQTLFSYCIALTVTCHLTLINKKLPNQYILILLCRSR